MINLKRIANVSKIKEIKITEMIKGLEGGIEKKFSSQPAYQQVKTILEGKAEKVDVKSLIADSRAMFSGDNKPELLAANVIETLKAVMDKNIAEVKNEIAGNLKTLGEQLETRRAVFENRRSIKEIKLKPDEAALSGRLVMNDGITPVAGAKVVVHGTGDDYSKIIATGITDINGEYIIEIDERIVKESPQKITIAFNSPKDENIAHSGDISLRTGEAIMTDMNISADKNEIAKPLTRSLEERKHAVTLEMAGLKKTEAELMQHSFVIEKSVNEIKAKFDGLKDLFVKKGS
jgi:hypothetical protein